MKIQFTKSFNNFSKKLDLENILPYKYEDEDRDIILEINFDDGTKEYLANDIGSKYYELIQDKLEEYLIELFKN